MKLSWDLSSLVCAGVCLLFAGTGCGAAAKPMAASGASNSASSSEVAAGPSTAAAEPSATAAEPGASAAANRAEPSAPSGFHLVEFVGLGRGDRIADLGPGRGYSIAPFSSAVGPFGAVYVRHDPRPLRGLASEQGSDAPDSAVPDNVIRMDTPLEAPFSPEAKNLDCATLFFAYHDLVAGQRDRHGFNAAVFRALKPGGCYIVAEHAQGSASAPAPAAPDPNRIDAAVVRADVEAAGFRFVEAADFHTPAAAVPAGAQPTAETSQYVLKFQKPRPR